MKVVLYHILPRTGVTKRSFSLPGKKIQRYANSLKAWVKSQPLGVAMDLHHDEKSPEVGTVVDIHLKPDGIWAEVQHTQEQFDYVQSQGFKRVSGRFYKNFVDFDKRKWDLVLQHLSFVKSPMFHSQAAPQTLRATMAERLGSGTYCEFSTKLKNFIKEQGELEMPKDYEKEEEVMETEEVIEVSPVEAAMEALMARVAALEAAVEAMKAEAEEEEEAPDDEPSEMEVDEEEDEEKVELSARVQVLRDTRGRSLHGWSEDELVEVKLSAPNAYKKLVSTLPSDKPAKTPTATPVSKVAGSTANLSALSDEEAFKKAKEAFEKGENFLASYNKFRNQL
jgi:hypothetical protein